MILHYITIALRNLARQKLSAFINVLGLSIGLACFSLFLLYAAHEFSFDHFHVQRNQIYRVYDWWKFPERAGFQPSSVTPIGPAMKHDLSDVEEFVRVAGRGTRLVRTGSTMLPAQLTYADPQMLSVFTFPLIRGDATTALHDPNSIVLTRTTALKLFGQMDVVGKEIEIREGDTYVPFVVTGVAEDIPSNSTLRFEMLGSIERLLSTPIGKESANNWSMTIGISVFVKLHAGSNLMHEPERLAAFRRQYLPDEGVSLKKEGLWDGRGDIPSGYGLQPLTDVHTNTAIDRSASDPTNIWMLIAIAGGVLVIACINFVILSVGHSAGRAREVGVRKIVGGQRKQLILQFLAESMVLTLIAAVVSMGIAQALLPFFNELSGRTLTFSLHHYPGIIAMMLATIVLTGLFAGSYPALVLSAFKPVVVLKSKIRFAGSNLFTRSLVTFQFIISAMLILVTIVIVQQLSFMRSKNLGFEKENIVMVSAQDSDSYEGFRRMLDSHTAVVGITAAGIGMGDGEGQMGRAYEFVSGRSVVIEYPVDANFLQVMDMELIAGRNFNPHLTADTLTSVIVNETLVAQALTTTPQQALGIEIKSARGDQAPKMIIGVVKDFHYEALSRHVRPQLFLQSADFKPSRYFVRLRSASPENIALLESAWKQVAPDLPFTYSFVDEKFDAFYKSEERWARIIGWAGNISILLACMGLFGLISLAAVNRTREIGIRRVLGASVMGITRLLCREFVILVLVAITVAGPIAWHLMHNWLDRFAYHIELSWLTFALTGSLVLLIAVLTVTWQAVKAALTDPVQSLRVE